MDVSLFRYCLSVVLLLWINIKVTQGTGRVQVRVDGFTVDGESVQLDPCCLAKTCDCGIHMHACVFDRNETQCGDDAFQHSHSFGGFTIGRTQTLFDMETDDRLDILELRLRITYGPDNAPGSLINEYIIDISSVPIGGNANSAPWIDFSGRNGLRRDSGDSLRVQVKIFCADNFYGELCQVPCRGILGKYTCDPITGARRCEGYWQPPHCEQQDVCRLYPCLNAGTCQTLPDGGFRCTCNPLYTGPNCSLAVDSCAADPCEKGVCYDLIESYECRCIPGYTGRNCELALNDCRTFPCENGQCLDTGSGFQCQCPLGFSGTRCETDVCSPSPCRNGGTCERLSATQWSCQCPSGYRGSTCDTASPCDSNPCQNGGECLYTTNGEYRCNCPQLYTGENCQTFESCLSSPCANGGTCTSRGARFTCQCLTGWNGATCRIRDPCASNPCSNNGICSVGRNGNFRCTCTGNYTGVTCGNLAPCALEPCDNGGTCSVDRSGNVRCTCSQGYSGDRCQMLDICGGGYNFCQNGGTCINTHGGYLCRCRDGFSGDNCQYASPCISAPCQNNGLCFARGNSSFVCVCDGQFTGDFCEQRDPCWNAPCNNGICRPCNVGDADCQRWGRDYKCQCLPGYSEPDCLDEDICSSSPCKNGGVCVAQGANTYSCNCPVQFTGPDCEELSPCSNDPCLNGGQCDLELVPGSSAVTFVCTCRRGFRGLRCEEDYRLCLQNPCLNGGSCHVIDGGRNLMCECPDGWTGDRCQRRIGGGDLNPCQNGGSLSERGLSFTCECTSEYTGSRCETKITDVDVNFCELSPCSNGATCVSDFGGFRCNCPPGYTGSLCQDIVEGCEGPCLNGGVCRSIGGRYRCECPVMYSGADCGVRQDPCSDYPCGSHGECSVQEDAPGGFICTCFDGYFGDTCTSGTRDACSNKPCSNGGECIVGPTANSFTCRCPLGYTGALCEQEDACASSPCLNGGSCFNRPLGVASSLFLCACVGGYTGDRCQVQNAARPVSPCEGVVTCLNGGVCVSRDDDSYTCQCPDGFTGGYCEQEVSTEANCGEHVCQNYGTCVNSTCRCLEGWEGPDCNHWALRAIDCEYCGPVGVCYRKRGRRACYCRDPTVVCSSKCETPHALQPHPYNCRLFIQCAWGVPYVKECPVGLYFNPAISVCDWPTNVNCGSSYKLYTYLRVLDEK